MSPGTTPRFSVAVERPAPVHPLTEPRPLLARPLLPGPAGVPRLSGKRAARLREESVAIAAPASASPGAPRPGIEGQPTALRLRIAAE